MTMWKMAVASLAGVLCIGSAQAQSFAKPEDAIHYRQSALNIIGTHFGAMGAMVSGKAPYNVTNAKAHADVVAYMARLPWVGFTAGSNTGATTRAKPDVWSNSAVFQANADKFQQAATALAAAAHTGQIDRFKAAFAQTAQTCKQCHDTFRTP